MGNASFNNVQKQYLVKTHVLKKVFDRRINVHSKPTSEGAGLS